MFRNFRWLAVAGIVVMTVLVGDVLWGELYPDPCPARQMLNSDRFPQMAEGTQIGRAEALPIFARKFNVTCTTCHTAFPSLNAFGRMFKENGYRFPGSQAPAVQHQHQISPTLIADNTFPIAAMVHSKIFEKTKGEDWATAPFDMVHLWTAGSVFKMGSAFVELGADADTGLQVVGSGRVGLHPSKYANVVAGIGTPFVTDPYNTLSGHVITLAELEGNDGFFNVYGRASKLYYEAGFFTGGSGDIETEPNGSARLALDVTPNIEVGAFGTYGKQTVGDATATDTPADTLLAGADFNIDEGNTHALGRFQLNKQTINDNSETNLSGFGQLYYTFISEDRPIFVPLVQVDYQQSNDGNDSTVGLLGNVSTYLFANARLGVEAQSDVATPNGVDKGYRLEGFGWFAW